MTQFRKVKHSLPPDLVDRLDLIAGQMDLHRSTVIWKLLESSLTEQMHFIHVVKGLTGNE